MKVQIEVFEEPEPLKEKGYAWLEFEIKKSKYVAFIKEITLLKNKYKT